MRAVTLTFNHPSNEEHPDEISFGPFESGVVIERGDSDLELKVISSGHVIAREDAYASVWLIDPDNRAVLPNGDPVSIDEGYAYEQMFIQPMAQEA